MPNSLIVHNKPGRRKTRTESDKQEYQKLYYSNVLKKKREYNKVNIKPIPKNNIIKVVDKIIVYI
jgi:hypothetical protein